MGKKVAAMAQVQDIALSPHVSVGPVALCAALHFDWSTPGVSIQENFAEYDVPWRNEVVQEELLIEPKGRLVRPGNRPGLGIEINEAAVRKHPFQQELPQRVFYSDGSIGDW